MGGEFTPREITGAEVVEEARRWRGVPYKPAGETLEGCCCAGLPFGVGKALGQIPADAKLPPHHPLNPSPRVVLGAVGEHCVPVELSAACPGDMLLMSVGERPVGQHIAFLSDHGLIQLFPAMSICRVTEHGLDPFWSARIMRAFRYRGVIAYGGKPETIGGVTG